MKIELPENYKDIEIKNDWFIAESEKSTIRFGVSCNYT